MGKKKSRAKRKPYLLNLFLLIFLSLFLIGLVAAVNIKPGVVLNMGSTGGSYINNQTTGDVISLLELDGTNVNVTFSQASDIWMITNGTFHIDKLNHNLTTSTFSFLLKLGEVLNITSGSCTVINMTGSQSDKNTWISNSDPCNLTFTMDDLDGECNYRWDNVSGNIGVAMNISYESAQTATLCQLYVELNDTTTNVNLRLFESQALSVLVAAAAIAAAGATVAAIRVVGRRKAI